MHVSHRPIPGCLPWMYRGCEDMEPWTHTPDASACRSCVAACGCAVCVRYGIPAAEGSPLTLLRQEARMAIDTEPHP